LMTRSPQQGATGPPSPVSCRAGAGDGRRHAGARDRRRQAARGARRRRARRRAVLGSTGAGLARWSSGWRCWSDTVQVRRREPRERLRWRLRPWW
jgi:hypothetical protein